VLACGLSGASGGVHHPIEYSSGTGPLGPAHSRVVSLVVARMVPSGLNATPHHTGAPVWCASAHASGHVPQPGSLVLAGGGEQGPVRAECYPGHPGRNQTSTSAWTHTCIWGMRVSAMCHYGVHVLFFGLRSAGSEISTICRGSSRSAEGCCHLAASRVKIG
jgi:hypothetical protein